MKRPERPENLISESKMVSLLTEVYLGNAARSIDNKQIRSQGVKIDSFLFAKYKVDSTQFAKSNAYYAADIDAYSAIIVQVQERLETMKQAENDKKVKENAALRSKNDSVQPKIEGDVRIDTTETKPGILIESAASKQ